MGNELSNGSPSDLESMKRYHGMSPGQVQLIKEKFELMADEDLTIDKVAFSQLMKLKENEVDKIFSFFDLANDGRIDSHEFVCALALISQAPLKEKAEIIFSLYDFDHNRTITKNELVILIKTTLTALGAMSQKGECTIQEAEQKAEDIFRKYDTNKDSTISLKEFQSFISKDSDILRMLFSYGIISTEDMRLDFGGGDQGDMPEPDSDLEKEVTRKNLAFDSKIERKKVGIEHKQGFAEELEEEEPTSSQTYQQFQIGRRGNNAKQWLNQVKNGAPSNWKPGKGDAYPPTASLELDYIYGFRCFDSRNNIKFTINNELVYPTAAVGVVLDTVKNQQKFFLEHTDDITCIDVFEKYIATGQVGNYPLICVWEVGTSSKAVLKGTLKYGVSHLSFSNDGKKLVAIGMDADHCIVVFDVEKAISNRGSGKKDDYLIAAGKGPRNDVFDVKFDKVDKNIILACRNEVYFATYDQFSIKAVKGLWDAKTCPFSSVTCIGTVETNVITGTFKGQLLIWRGNRATSSIEAHRGPVLAMHSKKQEPGLITGGKDGMLIVWDGNMKMKNKIYIQELNLKVLNQRICSIAENFAGNVIVIGTRGSDIIQISGQKSSLVMRGHSEGVLRGLTVHPKQQQFYTIGEDNILACWNVKDRKMMSCVKLDYPSRAIHISTDSRFLAVGSLNGTILIIDPKTLIPTFNFKDRDAEVSCIKFSHDTEVLAVGHAPPACEIIIYSIKNHFKKTNVLRGSPATILSIDFSMNCKILQVNDYSCQVLYYEIGGEGNQKVQPEGASRNKDEKWSTYTAIYGWHTQGVWPEVSSGNDINAIDRSQKGDILVTADDYSSVKLFRFPAPIVGQGYNRYSGHAAHVSNVRFTAEDEFVISLGGADKSIFQWKFSYDKDLQTELDIAADSIPDLTTFNEYLRTSPVDQNEEEAKVEGQLKQYLGPVKATVPNSFKPDLKRDNQLPNGHLTLSYVFGFKTMGHDQEALNLIKYLSTMKCVYPAGAVGVVMEMKPDKNNSRAQTFFRHHKEDINAISIHPKGQIVATGGRSFGLANELVSINIWDSESKQVISTLRDFHLRYVSAIAFTPDGSFVVSAGGDSDNSIAVHDWSTTQLLCTAKSGKSSIVSIVMRSQTEFVTCGQKSVKFYTMNGRNLKSTPASVGGQFEPMSCMTVAFQSNDVVTGSVGGNLYVWKDNTKPIKGHEGKVTSLVFDKQNLYSAGLDGKVIVWNQQQGLLTQVSVLFEAQKLFKSVVAETKNVFGIISMDIREDMMVVGTKCAEIYEISLSQQLKNLQIMSGHFDGELWGVACHPKQLKCVTCGGDSYLRLWDLETKKLLQVSKVFENDIRGVDWASNEQFLAVGDVKGFIYLVDATNLTVLDKKNSKFAQQKSRNNMAWIEDIKFSPDCTKVAFGAHSSNSHLEVWDVEGSKLNKQVLINLSLQGSLIHLDWATDNVHIVINSSNYELKFVNIIKAKDVPGPTVKDFDWYTWTSVLGFPVQGIYRSKEEYETVSLCASSSKQVLATGEFGGMITLFKYPAVCPPPQQHREYRGHSSAVTRVKFTHDDSHLVSVGALDHCVFVWQTDFPRGQQLEQQQEEVKYDADDDVTDLNLVQEKVRRFGGEKYGKVKKQDMQKFEQNDDDFGMEQQGKGEEFVSIKPWMGAIKEPSNYYKDPLNQNRPPMVDMQLEYVYGFRSKDCKNNVRYLRNGSIVFNAAALGVVLDPVANIQKFFNKHDEDVLCLDVNPDGIRVATGQAGAKPGIYVWDSNTQQQLCYFRGVLTKGVLCLAFNASGDKLAAVGLDDSHQIVVFDIQARSRTGGVVLYRDRIGTDTITDLRWKNDAEFCTFGINHLKQWQITAGGLKYKKVPLNKQGSTKFLCGGFLTGVNVEDCLAGGSDGNLQIFKGNVSTMQVLCHDGKPLEALSITKELYLIKQQSSILTGGRDFKINFLDTKGSYKILLSVKVPETVKGALQPEVKSVSISPDYKSLLVGTSGSEIYELTTKDAKITPNSKFQQFKPLLKGHCQPNRKTLNEVWGLAVNPNDQDQFYTCSDDGTLRAWSISQRKMVNMTKTVIDQNGNEVKPDDNGELSDSVRGRCIGVSPDGVYVVVGFKDGTLRVYDKELKQKMVLKCAKEWISDVKFSHDSQSLAVGSHDSTIYVYAFPEMKLKNKPLRKHASYITHIDFSQDGSYLHSNCGGFELLFWDVNQGKYLPTGANMLRDEKWLTWTSTLGWPVQGMWPEVVDQVDINTVDRSHVTMSGSDKPPDNYYLLATGDDMSNIKLYRYPCVKKQSQYALGRGHSSHITNVRFSNDDQYLFSSGGEDNTIMQWKLIKRR